MGRLDSRALIGAAAMLALVPGAARACSCMWIATEARLRLADLVYVGIPMRTGSGHATFRYEMEVVAVYKDATSGGLGAATEPRALDAEDGSCSLPLEVGAPYVVFASLRDDVQHASMCSGTGPLDARMLANLDRLGLPVAGADALARLVEERGIERARVSPRRVEPAEAAEPPPGDMLEVDGGPVARPPRAERSTIHRDGTGEVVNPPELVTARPTLVDGFRIDRAEVTEAQWSACVRAGGCREPAEGWCAHAREPGPADAPRTCVTSDDAADYCAWADKRRPTEAEWQRAVDVLGLELEGTELVAGVGDPDARRMRKAAAVGEWVADSRSSDRLPFRWSTVRGPVHGGAAFDPARRAELFAWQPFEDVGFRCARSDAQSVENR